MSQGGLLIEISELAQPAIPSVKDDPFAFHVIVESKILGIQRSVLPVIPTAIFLFALVAWALRHTTTAAAWLLPSSLMKDS